MSGQSVLGKLLEVQKNLKAPKNQKNTFSNFMYRSCEDILQAARPLCNANGLLLLLEDAIETIGTRYYVKATARVVDAETDAEIATVAYAREPESKTKFDDAQVTGASSSYARKYALCALFAIDDTKDADTDEYVRQSAQNGAQQTKAQSAKKNTQAQQKAPQSQAVDAEKALLKQLQDTAKKEDLSNDDITMMIQQKYGKGKWNDLTADEKRELATKTIDVWQEVMKKLGGAA